MIPLILGQGADRAAGVRDGLGSGEQARDVAGVYAVGTTGHGARRGSSRSAGGQILIGVAEVAEADLPSFTDVEVGCLAGDQGGVHLPLDQVGVAGIDGACEAGGLVGSLGVVACREQQTGTPFSSSVESPDQTPSGATLSAVGADRDPRDTTRTWLPSGEGALPLPAG